MSRTTRLCDTLSLISTQAFRLSPAKFFTWDMPKVVKQKEQDKKSFALFKFEVEIFQLCEIFLQRNQSDFFLESRGHFTRIKKFHKMAAPQLCQV